MKPKAIKDLSQLCEKEFFEMVSKGIDHIFSNANMLFQDAEILHKSNRQRGNSVLTSLANEEAAKILILLDAVRCSRKLTVEFSRQLGWFNDHLAKGIYSEACYWCMSTFGDLIDAVDHERSLYYLDGPNDIDWIFRNKIIGEREETIYVDYINSETDEGHYWHKPRDSEFFNDPISCALNLSEIMIDLGFTTPEGLKLIADFWNPIQMTPSFSSSDLRKLNIDTIEMLDKNHIIKKVDDRKIYILLDTWQFPMYLLDFQLSKEDNREKLREIQRNWSIEW